MTFNSVETDPKQFCKHTSKIALFVEHKIQTCKISLRLQLLMYFLYILWCINQTFIKFILKSSKGVFLVANNLNTCNSQDFEIDYKIFSNNRLSVSRTTSTSNMENGYSPGLVRKKAFVQLYYFGKQKINS